jgi:CubicO group peptidase (beta-lactamase class C family)
MRRRNLAVTFLALVLALTAHADQRFDRVANIVATKMKEYAIPGVALGVSVDGMRSTRDFGVTSLENPLLVTDDTIFQIGSITKTVTATAIVRLAEEGKIRLDAPVRHYLPHWRVKDDEATRRATVRTLLTHMGDWEGDLFADTGNGDDALARIVDKMSVLDQIAPFGTFWSYNTPPSTPPGGSSKSSTASRTSAPYTTSSSFPQRCTARSSSRPT